MNIERCPYCGNNSVKVSSKRKGNYKREGTYYYVMCNSCKAKGPIAENEQATIYSNEHDTANKTAIEKWNYRVISLE